MSAVDQPASKSPLSLGELIEMHPGGVLVKPGRDLVLALLDRHSVDVVNALPGRVVRKTVRASAEREVVTRNVEGRTGVPERLRRQRSRKARDELAARRRLRIAL